MRICNNCKTKLTIRNWHPSLRHKNSTICKSCHLKNGQKWRAKPKNKIKSYGYTKKWLLKHPTYQRDNSRKDRTRLRIGMIEAYGGECVRCKINDIDVLDIDHINNNGGLDRKNGMWGWRLYRWLKKNEYPRNNYQLLCRNCNWKKEKERRAIEIMKAIKQIDNPPKK